MEEWRPNEGRNGQMVGMVEWREWHMEWSNGGQKWLHTYYLWYTQTPTTMTMTGRMAEWHNGRMAGMADGIHIDDLIVVLRQNGRMAAEWWNG